MRVILSLVLVSSAAVAQIKLGAPGFTAVKVEEPVVVFYSDYFAQKLAEEDGVKVTTRSEMQALIGLEQQKQLLGCSDESTSCLAELAGALGVDAVIIGSLARLGSAYTVNIKIVSASNGETLALRSGRAEDDDALHKLLDDAAEDMAEQLRDRSPRDSAVAELRTDAATPTTKRNWPAIGAVGGGALLLGGGTLFYVQAKGAESRLRGGKERIAAEQLDGFMANARTSQTLGFVLGGAAVAALAAGAALFVVGGADQTVSVVPGADGAAVVLSGRLP